MQRLLMLGLNHTTAPLAVREQFAFSAEQQRHAVRALREQYAETELVLVSTCNRVELYVARAVHGQPRSEQIVRFLSEFHQVPIEHCRPHLYERSERDVISHLFSVAGSLDSMVIGESQILGQVRQAYELSAELGAAGAMLHPLFQRALAVGKEIQRSTTLGEGRVSVAGVAVSYARRIFDHFQDKTVLCIGAGKMAMLALRGFAALNPKKMIVVSRDLARAQAVAADFGGVGASMDDLDQHLVAADIVITSTGATEPIISRARFEPVLKLRRYRPIFMIDIALPRDIDHEVGKLEHVYLYNLDDLQKAVEQTLAQRGGALEQARNIVNQHVDAFLLWQRQRELGPAIDQLYKRFHDLAGEELQRTLRKMPDIDAAEKSHLEELARRIVNKLLHHPVQTLRNSEQMHGPAAQYLHALERIFGMNQGSSDASPDQTSADPRDDGG